MDGDKEKFFFQVFAKLVADELKSAFYRQFTALITWQGDNQRGHKHGCLLQQLQDASQVFATLSCSMLRKVQKDDEKNLFNYRV